MKRIRAAALVLGAIALLALGTCGLIVIAVTNGLQQQQIFADQTGTMVAYYAPLTETRNFVIGQLATSTQNAIETSSAQQITQTAERIEQTRAAENTQYAVDTATALRVLTQVQRTTDEYNATQNAALAATQAFLETQNTQVDHLSALNQGVQTVDFAASAFSSDVDFDPLFGTLALVVRNNVNEPRLEFQVNGVAYEAILTSNAFFVRLSPLGDWVAFQTVLNNDREIVLYSVREQREAQTFFGRTNTYTAPRAVWSPDGASLLVVAQEASQSSLFLLPFEDIINDRVDWQRLYTLGSSPFISALDWSSLDEIAYVATDTNMSNPRLRVLQGSESGALQAEAALPLPAGSRVQALRWSPDGQALLLLVNTTSGNLLYLLRFNANAELSLIGGSNSYEAIAWATPQVYLYSLANGSLYWQSLNGSAPVSIPMAAAVTSFDWYGSR